MRPVEARKHAVILNGVPPRQGGGGTQLKEPVELPATSMLSVYVIGCPEGVGMDVAGDSTGFFDSVAPPWSPRRSAADDVKRNRGRG